MSESSIGLGFFHPMLRPFPAKQLGRDVRALCSKEIERIGNEISERGGGVLPCSEVRKREGEK